MILSHRGYNVHSGGGNVYLIGAHQIEVEDSEAADEPHYDEGVDYEDERQNLALHRFPNGVMVVIPFGNYVQPREGEDVYAEKRRRRYEQAEEPVVALQQMKEMDDDHRSPMEACKEDRSSPVRCTDRPTGNGDRTFGRSCCRRSNGKHGVGDTACTCRSTSP